MTFRMTLDEAFAVVGAPRKVENLRPDALRKLEALRKRKNATPTEYSWAAYLLCIEYDRLAAGLRGAGHPKDLMHKPLEMWSLADKYYRFYEVASAIPLVERSQGIPVPRPVVVRKRTPPPIKAAKIKETAK